MPPFLEQQLLLYAQWTEAAVFREKIEKQLSQVFVQSPLPERHIDVGDRAAVGGVGDRAVGGGVGIGQ